MPRNNNDAYLLQFLGNFMQGYGSAKEKDREYKEKLAVAELEKKAKDAKAAADAKQQDFDNAMKVGGALADADRAGRETVYVDEKGQKHTTTPLAPDEVAAQRKRILEAAGGRGVPGYPGLPPLPAPAPGVVPPSTPNSAGAPPLPPMPNAAPLPAPAVPVPAQAPAKFAKFPTFSDDSTRQDAERRRYQASLSQDYEREAKPFKESVLAYEDARGAYQRSQLAKKTNQSSTVADKDLVLAMVSSRQGSRISDADFRLASQQGSMPEQWANWYSMAVSGKMTDQIRDQIFKLTRDAVVSREKEYKSNVEEHFTRKTKELIPGLDPSLVVRPVRPVDWEDIQKSYDAEYNGSPTSGAAWTEAQEKRFQELKRKLGK